MLNIIPLLFIYYTIPFSIMIYTILNPKYKKYYVVTKTLCSFTFISLSLFTVLLNSNESLALHWFPAFLFCLLGDIALGFYQMNKKQLYFMMGLSAFLIGHILFVYAFSKVAPLNWKIFIFPPFAVLTSMLLLKLPGMKTGKLKPAIYVYTFFISLLFASSIVLLWNNQDIHTLLIAIGATLFLISDAILLFLYFYKTPTIHLHILNLLSYYYGMFFLTISLLF